MLLMLVSKLALLAAALGFAAACKSAPSPSAPLLSALMLLLMPRSLLAALLLLQ
jgi:hypothetical protein